MNEQLLKTSDADVLFSWKNSEKPHGGGTSSPLPLYVRGLTAEIFILIYYL